METTNFVKMTTYELEMLYVESVKKEGGYLKIPQKLVFELRCRPAQKRYVNVKKDLNVENVPNEWKTNRQQEIEHDLEKLQVTPLTLHEIHSYQG